MTELPSKIRKIVIDDNNDVTFFFEDSEEGFSAGEFTKGTYTRRCLEDIEYNIEDFNTEVDLVRSS